MFKALYKINNLIIHDMTMAEEAQRKINVAVFCFSTYVSLKYVLSLIGFHYTLYESAANSIVEVQSR